MVDFNIGSILNVINTATSAVRTAKAFIEQVKDTGMVLSSDSEAQVDAALVNLENEYNALHANVQDKLRGTAPEAGTSAKKA